jgi:hypothetical protein
MTLTDKQRFLIHDLMIFYINQMTETYDSDTEFWDAHEDLIELEDVLLNRLNS